MEMALQIACYAIVGFLFAAYAVLDGYDLGVGAIYPFAGRTEADRTILINTIGPVWDGNQVWLIAAGGALFAGFPLVYATALSGLYFVIFLAVFGLILRAVSLEFRSRDDSWRRLWDWTLFVGSVTPAFLFGVAVGNMVRGLPLDRSGNFTGTLLGLFNPYALLIGVLVLAMLVEHGASWAALKTEADIWERVSSIRSTSHWVFLGLVAVATGATVVEAPSHFFTNVSSVFGWIMIVLLVIGVGYGRIAMLLGQDIGAFMASSLRILGLVGLWGVGNFPNLLPALGGSSGGLSISNASSTPSALAFMVVVAVIGIPIVVAYTVLVHWTFRGKAEGYGAGY